jgi:hypothetical protein
LFQGVFLLQHYFCVTARCQMHLYAGEVDAAADVLARTRTPMRRSLMLRVQTIRAVMLDVEGRVALAVARRDPSQLALATRMAQKLLALGPLYARAYGHLLAGLVARQRGELDKALAHLGLADDGFVAVRMPLHAAAARLRRGELLGGDEGAALGASAVQAARDVGAVPDPALFNAIAPP